MNENKLTKIAKTKLVKTKLVLISLGCEKNLVDSEMILGLLKRDNIEIIDNVKKADVIIVNTCGFIKSAKEEAINTIFDCINDKKEGAKLIVTGCLVQRYLDELKEEIPEVDLWVPIKDYFRFGDLVYSLLHDTSYKAKCLEFDKRIISTPSHLAYVRISDGCNNRCTYCAIPLIRGNMHSRTIEDIHNEVCDLVKKGYIEICLISQDLSNYGYDLNTTLDCLLKDLVKIEGLKWLRLLYLYPDEITKEFIQTVKENKCILPYFDIPLQHASNKLLKYMHRRGTKEEVRDLINYIRKEIPDAIIRTTMIVGFPHETLKDFNELIDFVTEMEFNHLGAFTYSKEEDTESYKMGSQVSEKVKKERLNILMDKQKWLSLSQNKKMVGKTYDCIIESYDEIEDKFIGRTYAFAPDDIDGEVIITNNGYKKDIIGKMMKVEIVDSMFYDLLARFV